MSPLDSSIVATVNGEAITIAEFREALEEARGIRLGPSMVSHSGRSSRSVQAPDPGWVPSDESERAFKRDLLDQLIDRRLFIREAARLSLSVEAQALQDAMDQVRGDYSQEDFHQILKSRKISLEEWKEKLKEDLLIRKLISLMVDGQIEVTEQEIADYYKTHREEFRQKEMVRVRQIVVASREEALEIQRLLISGQDFGKVAQARSLSPERAQGGDLGFLARGEVPEEFDVVFSLKVGRISPIVKSPYGYHLFKVVERRPGKTLTLREATEKIRTMLIENKREGRFREWVAGLRQTAEIRINDPLLDAPMPPSEIQP